MFYFCPNNSYLFCMEEQNKPSSQDALTAQQAWLKEVTNKSWNLELLISGAALWLTTYLPDAVEYLYEYQNQHFDITGLSKGNVKLPMLAYAFFKAVAYSLILTFTIHLVLRAFWVSLIGLQAAFPEGIRFDKIHNISPRMQQLYQQRLGSLSDYIIRLDKLCSRVMGVSFSIAFMGIGIGLLYLIIYAVVQAIQSANEEIGQFIYGAIGILATLLLVLSYWVRKNPDADAKYGHWVAKLSFATSAASIPFLSSAISYLTLTLMSNSTPRKYYTWMSVIMGLMMGAIFLILTKKIEDKQGTNLLLDYYYSGDASNSFHSNYYDNYRQPNQAIPNVSVQADIIQEAFVKVFVAYPPRINAQIEAFCPLPILPDSLQKKGHPMRDSVRAHNRLQCLTKFFRLSVNDSVYAQPHWKFAEKTGLLPMKGIIAYLPVTSMKSGQNILEIEVPNAEQPNTFTCYGALPFWVE
jgi:hypothetical protein